jgi:hypothetical protein
MKRAVLVLVGGFLLVAVGNKAAEAAGAVTCDCAVDCWCRRAGPNVFRWVFPWGHRSAHTTEKKAQLGGHDRERHASG